MTKQQVEQIIDFLDTKAKDCNSELCIGLHDIFIGDVLSKFPTDKVMIDEYVLVRIYTHWRPCGVEKSLKQIVKESGWEWRCSVCGNTEDNYILGECRCQEEEPKFSIEHLKSTRARALFKLLGFLFLNKKYNERS